MEMYATIVYVVSEEVLRILKVEDDPQSKMSNAEVITFAILTAKFFSGNYKMARYLCKKLRLFPNILSNSRLNRRIHRISWIYWHAIFVFYHSCLNRQIISAILRSIAFLCRIAKKIGSIRERDF
jgi:hypothetical protein